MSTIIRRRFNQVNAIKDGEDQWCTDSRQIKQIIVDHFRMLFSEDATAATAFKTQTADFPRLSLPLMQVLQQPFIGDDIVLALKGMAPYKAPGPDGFHTFFFQRYWHLVREDIYGVVLQVLRGQSMPSGLNDTFITLIPKAQKELPIFGQLAYVM